MIEAFEVIFSVGFTMVILLVLIAALSDGQ